MLLHLRTVTILNRLNRRTNLQCLGSCYGKQNERKTTAVRKMVVYRFSTFLTRTVYNCVGNFGKGGGGGIFHQSNEALFMLRIRYEINRIWFVKIFLSSIHAYLRYESNL